MTVVVVMVTLVVVGGGFVFFFFSNERFIPCFIPWSNYLKRQPNHQQKDFRTIGGCAASRPRCSCFCRSLSTRWKSLELMGFMAAETSFLPLAPVEAEEVASVKPEMTSTSK